MPGFVNFENSYRSTLKDSGDSEFQFYVECMDLTRFPTERYREELLELYRVKYSDMKLDLILAVQFPSAQFAAEYLNEAFCNTPVLLCNLDARLIGDQTLMPNATVVTGKLDFAGTMALALRIHPDVRKVFVVSGASKYDQSFLGLAMEELRSFESRVELSYLSGLPMNELIHRVSNLPEHSLILYIGIFRDGTGKAFKSPEALAVISRQANAPIYSISETYIGSGIVGGNLISQSALGVRSAQVALCLLAGKKPNDSNHPAETGNRYIFDARQLKRWGISEAALPPGSTLIYKQFSVWESYRWTILGVLAFVLLQTLLIAGLIVNLGKRRRAELKLGESRSLLSALVDSASDMIWSVDSEDFGLLTFNRGLYEYVLSQAGIRIEVGMRPEDLFADEEFVQKWHMFYRRALDEGSFTTDYLVYRGIQTLRLKLNRLERDGILFGVSVFGQDITERKRAEEALVASEARYRAVADHAYAWEYWLAPDGSLNYVSPSCERISGYSPHEFIDSPSLCYEIILPEDRAIWDWHEAYARHECESREIQFRIITRDGEIRWIDHSCRPVTDPNGHFQGIRASNRDVTERKMAEAKALQHRDELSHVTRVAALGELTSSLAHELNQPLAAILNYTNAAQRFLAGAEPNLSKVGEALQGIIRDEKRAAEVIRTIRDLLRKQKPHYSALDINDVVSETLCLFRDELMLQGVSVMTELAPGLPGVRADKIQLQQVLINLTLNAVDAMSPVMLDSPRLVFMTEVWDDEGVKVSVRDFGPGLDEDLKERLFEPFYTTKPEGFGMGLAICHNIIDAHGGAIWAENNPDGGATFHFTLQAAAR
jgi:PAS domain S-box-containing protein